MPSVKVNSNQQRLNPELIITITTALDLRAMQFEFHANLTKIVVEELTTAFGAVLTDDATKSIIPSVTRVMHETFDKTSTMDARERLQKVAASSTTPLLDFFTGPSFTESSLVGTALTSIPGFRTRVAERLYTLLDDLRREFLSGVRGPAPASAYLNKTRPVYEFVRLTLGIRMHGTQNYHRFENGVGVEDQSVGQNVSLIHEVRSLLFFLHYPFMLIIRPHSHRLFVMGNSKRLSLTCSQHYRVVQFLYLFSYISSYHIPIMSPHLHFGNTIQLLSLLYNTSGII